VRLVVRGRERGSVGTVTGVAAEHTKWHDSWRPGQRSAALAVDGAPRGPRLPVGSGVVLASVVRYAEPAGLVEPAELVEPVETTPPPVTDPEPVAGTGFAQLFEATQHPPVLTEEPEPAPEEPDEPDEPQRSEDAHEPESLEPELLDPSATMATPLTIPPENLPERPAAAASEVPTPTSGLITGMPWLTGTTEPAAEPAHRAPTQPLTVPTPRPAAGAAAPVAEPAPAPAKPPSAPATPPEVASDRTVNRASLVGRPPVVMVTAIRCAHDHFNPPYAGKCRVCGAPMPPQHPTDIPRPTLGQLRLSTGGVVPLDRPAFLGRNPQVPTGYAAEQPNLVRLPDPDKDVSGQHLEVSLDYWNVLVRDLGSTNGTEVILPGEMPVVLRANDPVIIEPGTRVVLAGTISFIFEVVA
jgi:hypothetical protein